MIIYADDTTFFKDKNSGEEVVGVGCLLLEQDNTVDIIATALEQLSNNPSTDNPRAVSMDRKTISNRYFHASENSYNAHAILTENINRSLTADFQYSYSPSSNGGKEEAWQQCLEYLSLMTNQSKEPVTIYLEQGVSNLRSALEKTIENVNYAIDQGKYQLYAIPSFYPKIEIKIVDKLSSGVQIVDLLLWSNNRKNLSKSDVIAESKFKCTSKSVTGDFDSYLFQGTMTFKRGVRDNLHEIYPKDCFPLPNFSGNEQIGELFEEITNRVINFLLNSACQYSLHIQNQYKFLIAEHSKNNELLSIKTVKDFAQCFIRIFDTIPIYYGVTDTTQFQQLIMAKRLCGLLLSPHIHSVTTAQFLVHKYRSAIKFSAN